MTSERDVSLMYESLPDRPSEVRGWMRVKVVKITVHTIPGNRAGGSSQAS